jgi:hypothetical protein
VLGEICFAGFVLGEICFAGYTRICVLPGVTDNMWLPGERMTHGRRVASSPFVRLLHCSEILHRSQEVGPCL